MKIYKYKKEAKMLLYQIYFELKKQLFQPILFLQNIEEIITPMLD